MVKQRAAGKSIRAQSARTVTRWQNHCATMASAAEQTSADSHAHVACREEYPDKHSPKTITGASMVGPPAVSHSSTMAALQ
jgi:hypothetical protein